MTPLPDLVEEFTFGKCYALAVALHEETGWPIGALVADWKSAPGSETIRRRVVHAFVRLPDGSILDARGPSDECDLRNTFFGPEKVIVKSWVEDFDDVEAFKACLVSTEVHLLPERQLRQEIDEFFTRTMPAARAACVALDLVTVAMGSVRAPTSPGMAVR